MAIRFAVVGPGRVGAALARALREHGGELLGFVGRRPEAVAAALAFCGGGRDLALTGLRAATVVLLTVGDAELPDLVSRCADAGPRPCSLWLHTSGRHGLEVLAPLASKGARIGSLHPVLPFPDAERGYRALGGAPAVLQGPPRSLRLLQSLCRRVGLQPLVAEGGDRLLYHAACALAANGLTALVGLVDRLLQQGSGLAAGDAASLRRALMGAALAATGELGPAAALSGPVLRGDLGTVTAHLQRLAAVAPTALPTYQALMQQCLVLAAARGLPPAAQAALARALAGGP